MTAAVNNPTEARRQEAQAGLDTRRSAAERNRLGQFATPHTLAVDIARYVRSIMDPSVAALDFADPALGTGSFFSAAHAVFGPRFRRALGVEIDPECCSVAADLWGSHGLEVICADFTRIVTDSSNPAAPNLVFANPPYVRHHHLTQEEKRRLKDLVRRLTRVEVNGLAGLYVYFLLLATAWMRDQGYAAWLIPSEFMDVNYGAAVKRFLTDQVTLLRVHRFNPDDVQFGDALVSSVVLVFRKAPPPCGHAVRFTFGGAVTTPETSESIPLGQLAGTGKWTSYPRHPSNDRSTSGTAAGPTLGDFFLIRRGIATGADKFFVLDRSEAVRRDLPSRYLRPILPSPRRLKVTVIDADESGYPVVEPQLCLIDCDLPEEVIRDRHPGLWAYLRTADGFGIRDRYLPRKRNPWYKQEQREPAPFLCTYMGRGADQKRPFRFICNRSQAIGTNLYLLLYPRSGLAEILRNDPAACSGILSLLSDVTGHELRGEGRVYGGGLQKIEPNELARVSAVPLVGRWPSLRESVSRQGRLF